MLATVERSEGKPPRRAWTRATLGELCRTTSGGTPSRTRPDYFGGEIPWVKSGELTDGLVSEIEEFITDEALTNSSAKVFPAGTLLIALYGATVGKLGLLTRAAASNQAVCAIFPPPEVETKFLFWYLRHRRAELVAQAVGGAQPNISQAILRSLDLPVPPIEDQRRIVAEIEKQFSRLDEAVANLKRVKANLKRYKAAVLKAAVEGRLVPTEAELARREGRSYETGAQLLRRILETRRSQRKARVKYKEPTPIDSASAPQMPEGWIWASADQITSVITDGEHITPKRVDTGVLLLSARNILDGRLSLDNVDYVPQSEYDRIAKRLVIDPGDVLLSCSGSVGRSTVAPEDLVFTLVRSVAVLKPMLGMGEFISLVLRSPLLQQEIAEKKTQTAQANIFQGRIKTLRIPLPPIAEQRRIVAEIDRCLSIVSEIENEVDVSFRRSERLRQSALREAFEAR